ncbi:glycosyl hydrolase [Nesterenkonia sp. K-15-9-6]|uniref:glycosyl hydrolase n=1 Tax=Nesterenkonia sp. K-15-9-6 TaxID=3093918 RepID=UPI004044F92F
MTPAASPAQTRAETPAQTPAEVPVGAQVAREELWEGFRAPDPAARPMMRWWWFGPDVRREDLARDLDRMREAGLGGVEVAVVYPLSAGTDRYLSGTFLADLRFAAEAAQQRGLRFDVTLGSGWPYGGPHVDESTAARKISWTHEEVAMAAHRLPIPAVWPGDEFIAGYIGEGTTHETPQAFTPLATDGGDLLIPEGRGPRVVLIAVSRLTRQALKRAAVGAEGWALDHLSAEAARAHLDAVAEPLVEAVGVDRIGTVFCDSLEVYDADWTPRLPEEFAARRGYDVVPHLWKLPLPGQEGAAFRADYHRTLTELLEENFIRVIGDWARQKGVPFRIQGYGEPAATVSSYRYADRYEGEGWGWDVVTACRWASSAGQIHGQQVISSEAWTWTHSPSFRSTPLDILAEAQDHLLMGINQFIGHGWPNSSRPEDASLGRVFYASGALDDRNTWWAAAPALWGTVHRLSWLMRQGHRLSDVGIYVPARDVYAGFAAAGRRDLYKETRQHIGDELPHALRTAGADFDLFDDDAVAHLDPGRFPVVVLPSARDIPEPTRAWLAAVVEAGGAVLDLGGTARLGVSVDSAAEATRWVSGPVRLAGADGAPNETVAVTTRQLGAGRSALRVHFVANTGSAPAEVTLSFRQDPGRDPAGSTVERWDAETGEVLSVHHLDPGGEGGDLPLRLEAYEAAVLIQHDGEPQEGDQVNPSSTSAAGDEAAVELTDWQVRFPDEPEPRPVSLPHQWEQVPGRELYSGTAEYTTTLQVDDDARQVILDFGAAEPHKLADPASSGLMEASFRAEVTPPVGVVAVVRVDGREAGVVWRTPYRVDLTGLVTPGGTHVLTVEVANVTSHRLAADDALTRMVETAREHHGRRFGMQALELALADVASGLLAVPRLRVRRRSRLRPVRSTPLG